jgi:magnesium-transporting ATPase (P-type)
MMIRTPTGKEQYKLLHILEFNSTRKRMSVILRDKDNKIILMTKGADSIVQERMIKNQYREKFLEIYFIIFIFIQRTDPF